MRVTQNTYSLTVGAVYTDAVGEPELVAIGSYNYCKQVMERIIRDSRELKLNFTESEPGENHVFVGVTAVGSTKRCYVIEDMRYVYMED